MSAFVLKVLAAVSMLLDHTGLLLFPQSLLLRAIGRLAFPLYAYCIAEGFHYTRNRKRYFLQILLLGLLCQIVYFFADGSLYLGVLITFSLSLLLLSTIEWATKDSTSLKWLLPLLLLIFCFFLCRVIRVDYGFFGILLPVLIYFPKSKPWKLVFMTVCLFALTVSGDGLGAIQWWSFLSLPLLALYNGSPGKYRMKYFFYLFYPGHLAILYLLSMLFH